MRQRKRPTSILQLGNQQRPWELRVFTLTEDTHEQRRGIHVQIIPVFLCRERSETDPILLIRRHWESPLKVSWISHIPEIQKQPHFRPSTSAHLSRSQIRTKNSPTSEEHSTGLGYTDASFQTHWDSHSIIFTPCSLSSGVKDTS